MTAAAYRYYRNCVAWPLADVDSDDGLCAMIDAAIDITRGTFLRHVDGADLRALETGLGYDTDLRMAADWHVSYHRSRLHGRRVYYFRHSAIEYVFTQKDTA